MPVVRLHPRPVQDRPVLLLVAADRQAVRRVLGVAPVLRAAIPVRHPLSVQVPAAVQAHEAVRARRPVLALAAVPLRAV